MNKILGSGLVASGFAFGLSQDSLWGVLAGLTLTGLAGFMGWRLRGER